MGHVRSIDYKKITKVINDATYDRETGELITFEETVCINSKYDSKIDAYICYCRKCRKHGARFGNITQKE